MSPCGSSPALFSSASSFTMDFNGGKDGRHAPLHLRAAFRVECDSQEIICYQPDGSSARVSWSDLQKIEIVTTDEGPFPPDVFWILHGIQHRCTIPQGATGDDLLLERL